jgi:succinate dehydrogenase / fumarate reductase, membrane anchor subunit
MRMVQKSMRSPLAQATGLGSAKEGVQHWWRERVTAVALTPLTLWFIASMIACGGSDYIALIAWLRTPFSTLMMVLLLAALFYHAAIGLQVIIEDYVHSSVKVLALIIMRLSCFTLAVAGILAVLRVALNG